MDNFIYLVASVHH